MPHTTSAEKRLRQTEKRRARNREVKKGLKLQIRKFTAALESGTTEAATTEFKLLAKKLDKAGSKRVLHPNTVSRKKSLYARRLYKKTSAPAAPAPTE